MHATCLLMASEFQMLPLAMMATLQGAWSRIVALQLEQMIIVAQPPEFLLCRFQGPSSLDSTFDNLPSSMLFRRPQFFGCRFKNAPTAPR